MVFVGFVHGVLVAAATVSILSSFVVYGFNKVMGTAKDTVVAGGQEVATTVAPFVENPGGVMMRELQVFGEIVTLKAYIFTSPPEGDLSLLGIEPPDTPERKAFKAFRDDMYRQAVDNQTACARRLAWHKKVENQARECQRMRSENASAVPETCVKKTVRRDGLPPQDPDVIGDQAEEEIEMARGAPECRINFTEPVYNETAYEKYLRNPYSPRFQIARLIFVTILLLFFNAFTGFFAFVWRHTFEASRYVLYDLMTRGPWWRKGAPHPYANDPPASAAWFLLFCGAVYYLLYALCVAAVWAWKKLEAAFTTSAPVVRRAIGTTGAAAGRVIGVAAEAIKNAAQSQSFTAQMAAVAESATCRLRDLFPDYEEVPDWEVEPLTRARVGGAAGPLSLAELAKYVGEQARHLSNGLEAQQIKSGKRCVGFQKEMDQIFRDMDHLAQATGRASDRNEVAFCNVRQRIADEDLQVGAPPQWIPMVAVSRVSTARGFQLTLKTARETINVGLFAALFLEFGVFNTAMQTQLDTFAFKDIPAFSHETCVLLREAQAAELAAQNQVEDDDEHPTRVTIDIDALREHYAQGAQKPPAKRANRPAHTAAAAAAAPTAATVVPEPAVPEGALVAYNARVAAANTLAAAAAANRRAAATTATTASAAAAGATHVPKPTPQRR